MEIKECRNLEKHTWLCVMYLKNGELTGNGHSIAINEDEFENQIKFFEENKECAIMYAPLQLTEEKIFEDGYIEYKAIFQEQDNFRYELIKSYILRK